MKIPAEISPNSLPQPECPPRLRRTTMTKATHNFAAVAASTMLVIAIVALGASVADAGHKCPNRYFKKVPVKGVGDTEANAQKAYDEDLPKKIASAKDDCKDCECEEKTESCTFVHTQSKKAKCTPQGPGFKCVGNIRPGCFCFDEDEDF